MKNFIFLIAIASVTFLGCASSRSNVAVNYREENVAVGYEAFYNELSPYGRWVDYPSYGYVWVPAVEMGFRPYATNGHWVYSDYGWTWVSNYQWGWAAFHYGRWMYEDGYGWMWLPGSEWAPAWVMWGRSGGYYGWAPLAPNVNIHVSIGSGWTPPQHYWNFVPEQHITQVNINNYVVNNNTNVTVVNNITKNVTIINNNTNNHIVYNMGPRKEEVEKATNQNVTLYKMASANKPGQTATTNGQVVMYKPAVKEVNTVNKPVPQKVEAYTPRIKQLPKNTDVIKTGNPSTQNNMNVDTKNNTNNNTSNTNLNAKTPVRNTKPVDEKPATFQNKKQAPLNNNQPMNNKPGQVNVNVNSDKALPKKDKPLVLKNSSTKAADFKKQPKVFKQPSPNNPPKQIKKNRNGNGKKGGKKDQQNS